MPVFCVAKIRRIKVTPYRRITGIVTLITDIRFSTFFLFQETGAHLYLIIDEYDNFTNVVLNEQGNEVYHALTHASGFYREIFKKFKGMFERIFMTGEIPVAFDDFTNGFNIGWDISTDSQFNMMLGFSETEVCEMIQYYKEAGKLPADVNIETMIEEIMIFYYLLNYMDSGKSPDKMIDIYTRTDYNKIRKLTRLDELGGNRKAVLRKITEEGQIVTTLATAFIATDIIKTDFFPSMLFYYGMLTITAICDSKIELSVPNNNVRQRCYEFLLEEYQDNRHIDLNDPAYISA